MPLFDVPIRAGIEQDKAVAKKTKTKAKTTTARITGSGLAGSIKQIEHEVDTKLGKYKDEYQIIREKEVLHDFITNCIGNGYISIDTETSGLDPLQDQLAGICPYTYGERGSYIPLNHISYITNQPLANQLPMEFVMSEFKRLLEHRPEIDMFNSPFDIRFLIANGLPGIYCTWDGYLAARCLNENEPANGLKPLHNKYCLDGKGDAFSFDALFKGVKFTMIPPEIGYMYAAHDPVITTELCDFQRKYLTYDPTATFEDRNGMNGVAWAFKNIEMPIVDTVVELENNGIDFDFAYNHELAVKYHSLLDEKMEELHTLCKPYIPQLREYREKHEGVKLDIPINFASPTQVAILLYDILKLDAGVDKRTKKPIRGTGEDIISKLDHPICKALLDYRGLDKLVGTYIDKMPDCVNPKDHRIHGNFDSYGADTGRWSSKDPNLQNIPSHNKDIRKMFKATDGYVMMSSDYSQQEPRSLAALCKRQGDSQMYDTFMAGKDLYAEIASASFHKPYEDCLEFYLDENGKKTDKTNKEGKERRSRAKSILLGALYGRGVESIAEQLGCSTQEAQDIKDSVFKGFPAIKKFEDDSLRMARELGYVTTIAGRKRRLPELQLPDYEFQWLKGHVNPYEDPLDFSYVGDNSVPDDICDYFLRKLQHSKFDDRQKVYKEANARGIDVINNMPKKAEATRQCVNARIQGSASDLTKLAMIGLYKSERLRELGFRMLIPIHDEILAECPKENAKECAQLLAQIMSEAAAEILEMPIGCDVEVTDRWYGEPIDGTALKVKESTTSHSIDVETLRNLREDEHGNQ